MKPAGSPAADRLPGKRRALALIILAQILALSVWFAGAAALPALLAETPIAGWRQAALTSAVQIGFVLGALASAILGLPDRFDARRVFAAGAIAALFATLVALVLEPGGIAMIASRGLTGAALALVYPVGMKLAASWARGDAGLLVGLLVGALTLGSASPFLFNLFGETADWRTPFLVSAGAAGLAGLLILAARAGPGFRKAPAFQPAAMLAAFRDPALRLANFGYLGHMWELYAMWAWIGPFALAYWTAQGGGQVEADLTAFSVVAIGTLGCVGAGLAADRFGRTAITMLAMTVSGSCALMVGLFFQAPPAILLPVLMIWGIAVIADSAQFSASITELAPPDRAGTLLTVQTALGFALTAVMVQLLPVWISWAGWNWAFAPLAVGPAFGVWAMWRLRNRPEAARLAGGRR